MKSKLWYLMTVSLKRKIKTKWFLVANILLGLVIVGIINIDSVITFFGGDFDKKQPIYIIDNTDLTYDLLEEQIKINDKALNDEDDYSYEIKLYEKDIESVKKEIEENNDIVVIELNKDDKNILNVKIISQNYIDTIDYQILVNSINNVKAVLAINELGLTQDEINKIYSDTPIEREILDEDKKSEDENMQMIMTTVFPVVILPFFMLSLFLIQMIGAEVNDEKTTRGMEIIISNVSPKIHFFAKVIAGNLFVLIQGLLLLIFSGMGILIRNIIGESSIAGGIGGEIIDVLKSFLGSGFADKLLYIIPLTLIAMILTFISYSLLAGILASVTTNTEDFQQLQTPIIIISLVGYYLSMMAGVFDGSIFIRILSYVPLLSAVLSPSLLMLGQIGIVDMLISIVILIITNLLLVKYGLRIYKVGILNYSSRNLWKKMFKAIRVKD